MAVNRYDQPAQAQFMNTYVPIPFEQLYTLGKQAKDDVDKALSTYSTALEKWSDFKSQSAKDMQTWDRETRGRALPVIEEMSRNLDMIKSPEGRMKLYSVINNTNTALLNSLKQNASNFETYNKAKTALMASNRYNPLWHDKDFSNWDTSSQGLYTDLTPLGYQSVNDLVHPYVDNLKPSDMGSKNGFLIHGVSKERTKAQVDANLSNIMKTPEAQMHITTSIQAGMTPEEATNSFINEIYTAATEKAWEDKVGADPYALQALKYRQAMDVAALRKKDKKEETDVSYPDAYNKLYSDVAVQEQRNVYNNPAFEKTRATITQLENVQNGLRNLTNELEQGLITPEQYKSEVEEYKKLGNQLQQNGTLGNALAEDVAEMFAQTSGIFPKVGVKEDKLPLYYNTSSRVLNTITYPASGQIINTYNKVSNANEIEINSGDVITKGYSSPDTRGAMLATDFVNKVMKVPTIKYMVQTTDGLERNFGADLESGVFENIIKVPRGKIAPANFNGTPQLAQRVSVKIPLQSIKNAGYDESSFRKMVNKTMGITGELGLSVKPVNKENIEDAWGTQSGRGGAALTGEYFTFDIMEPIDPQGLTRMTFDQEVNDIHGGSKLQNDRYEDSYVDSYENIINTLLQ